MRKVFGRGVNVAAQIDNTRKNYPNFVQIQKLRGYKVLNVGCGFMQSYFFLDGGQVIKNGYILDTVSSARSFNYYRLFPKLFTSIQAIPFLHSIAFKGGQEQLTALNRQYILQDVQFTKAVFNQAGIHLFDKNQTMYSLGQNYFGQRATGDSLTKQSDFKVVRKLKMIDDQKRQVERKIVDIALGFQHSILITQFGEAYGCGKAIDYQIQPYKYHHYEQVVTLQKFEVPQLIYNKKKIVKAAGGFKHSLLVTEDNKILALGNNKFGQCGINYLQQEQIPKIQQVHFPLRKGQQILDLKCGFNHSWILTNYGLYFTGSLVFNQNPLLIFQQNTGAFTLTNLPNNEKPIKIFTNFDRSAIVTQQGTAYVFGGRNYSHRGGESGKLQILDSYTFDKDSQIGLGLSHTILCL